MMQMKQELSQSLYAEQDRCARAEAEASRLGETAHAMEMRVVELQGENRLLSERLAATDTLRSELAAAKEERDVLVALKVPREFLLL